MIIETSQTLSLKERFCRVRKKTEDLTKPLGVEDFSIQVATEISPPKWHLAHTSWFFENFILNQSDRHYQLFSPAYNYLFNSYYNSQGDRILRDRRGSLSRPSTKEIFNYRKHVDEQMEKLLENEDLLDSESLKMIEIGINHEQQHQELLITDIKYILGSNPLLPTFTSFQALKFTEKPSKNWLSVEEGLYEVGYEGRNFHFDNEEGKHKVYLNSFSCRNQLVSNGEFIEFIEDGGYQNPALWLSDGWDWVCKTKATAPLYWLNESKEWMIYRLDGLKKIELLETATHLNFYEADAFARWKGMRLLTEFEWEVAALKYGKNDLHQHFQKEDHFHPGIARGNQFFGTAWEWTNSAYLPYPSYRQSKGALGEYNGKFMINQMVLRGGSCATPKDHFRPSYRNFFYPNARWQFTAIRLAKNEDA